MAAVLAGGAGAVLSHHAAAALWQLRDSRGGPIDVTITGQRRAPNGIRFHRAAIPPDERTTLHGIPVTSMPRTIFDLAAGLDERPLERPINEADCSALTDRLSLDDLLTRYPRRTGAPKLSRRSRAGRPAPRVTRSEMEELFLNLLERHGLPRPRMNTFSPGVGEVDCTWPAQRLAVELDSRRARRRPGRLRARSRARPPS